jgi:hypothetical protein
MHHQFRRALVCAIAGGRAAGALAGPAMAASDAGPAAPEARKSGADQHEYLAMRKSGGDPDNHVTLRKAGGPLGYIIAVL